MEIRVKEPKIGKVPPNQPIIILQELDGTRIISICLDIVSLTYIQWQQKNIFSGPIPDIFKFTHILADSLLASIEKVVIYDLSSIRCLASVIIRDNRNNNRPYKLELHVTNAIALAISAKCPIFVEEKIFDQYAAHLKKSKESAIKIQQETIFNDLNPDKMTKH